MGSHFKKIGTKKVVNKGDEMLNQVMPLLLVKGVKLQGLQVIVELMEKKNQRPKKT
jgi:hypothetical protein